MDSDAEDATIVIFRMRDGWRDRARSYVIMVDGRPVGKIKHGQRVESPTSRGQHELFLKISWCMSRSISFEADAGEVIEFSCQPGGPASAALPDVLGNSGQYIKLDRVDRNAPWPDQS